MKDTPLYISLILPLPHIILSQTSPPVSVTTNKKVVQNETQIHKPFMMLLPSPVSIGNNVNVKL